MASKKDFFHWVHNRRLGLDDWLWWLGANRLLDCWGVNFFVYLLVFIFWSSIVC